MSNFISNLISRHIAPAKNVMPRLRGKFEPENNSSNALPGDIGSTDENFTQQAPASQQFSPTANKDNGIEKAEPDLSFDSKPLSFENPPQPAVNTHQPAINTQQPVINTQQPVIKNDQPVKPLNTAPDEFVEEPLQNKAHVIGEPVEWNLDKKIIQKENHLIITNSHKTINEELVTNRENEKENDISTTVKTNRVDPVIENKEFTITPPKQGGLLGDPPAFNNSKTNQNFVINHSDDHAAPVITVSIGQINVRAVTATPVTTKKTRTVVKPALSLEDYLKQRTKGQ